MIFIFSGPQTAFFSHITPKDGAYPRLSNSLPIYSLRFTFGFCVSISVLITSSEYKCSMQIPGVAVLKSGIGSIKEYTLLPHFLNCFPSFPPSFLLVSLWSLSAINTIFLFCMIFAIFSHNETNWPLPISSFTLVLCELLLGSYSRNSNSKPVNNSAYSGICDNLLYAVFICFQSVVPSVTINILSCLLLTASYIACSYCCVLVKYV